MAIKFAFLMGCVLSWIYIAPDNFYLTNETYSFEIGMTIYLILKKGKTKHSLARRLLFDGINILNILQCHKFRIVC